MNTMWIHDPPLPATSYAHTVRSCMILFFPIGALSTPKSWCESTRHCKAQWARIPSPSSHRSMARRWLEVGRKSRRPGRECADADGCDALHQAFKFTCYLTLPVFLTVVVAGTPQNLATIIKNVRPAANGRKSSSGQVNSVAKAWRTDGRVHVAMPNATEVVRGVSA